MKKDDMLEITIEDISSDGSGVGKADGFALFVKDTIPGDQVKVKIMKMKKRYGYARLMEILVPSPDRIQAPCPVARQCGGCQIQQMSYERQLTCMVTSLPSTIPPGPTATTSASCGFS